MMRNLYAPLLLTVLAGCDHGETEAAPPSGDTVELVYPGQEDAEAQEAAAQKAAEAITEENADDVLESLEALIGSEEE